MYCVFVSDYRHQSCWISGNEGLSLLLVSPEEITFYNRLCKSMKLTDGITQFPCDMSALNSIKKTVKLAKEIDSMGHIKKKVRVGVSCEENNGCLISSLYRLV